mgnify:FL=1
MNDEELLGIYAGGLDTSTAESLLNKIQSSEEFAQQYRDTPVTPLTIEERFGVNNNQASETRDYLAQLKAQNPDLEAELAEEFAETIAGLYDDEILEEVEGGTLSMDEMLTMMDGTHPKMQNPKSDEFAGLKRLKMILSGEDPKFDTRRLGSNALELQQVIGYQGFEQEDASNRAIEAGLNMGKEIPTPFPSEYMFEGYRAGGRTKLI